MKFLITTLSVLCFLNSIMTTIITADIMDGIHISKAAGHTLPAYSPYFNLPSNNYSLFYCVTTSLMFLAAGFLISMTDYRIVEKSKVRSVKNPNLRIVDDNDINGPWTIDMYN